MSTNKASIVAVIGASGSGKSLWMKQGLRKAKPSRLLAWDPQGEYAEFGTVFTDRPALLKAAVAAGARGKLSAVFQPGERIAQYAERFDWLCALAYDFGNCKLVIEELADVTKPSSAPEAWSVVTRKGRHKGLGIIAASQRPASVDKDFFGNCTMIHCGRLNYEADIRTMSNVLRVSADEISDLAELEFIERDMKSGVTRKGKVIPT